MRKLRAILMVVALCAVAPSAIAQEKAKTEGEERPKPLIPLKVQVAFNEYEGEKKVSSLPYILLVNADERGEVFLRMGVRVPVYTGGKESQAQYQYLDVGSNIDCNARSVSDGQFKLQLSVERSSVYSAPASGERELQTPGGQPLLRQFRLRLSLLMRDGQTVQGTMATDPQSGRVLRVDVTLNVVK